MSAQQGPTPAETYEQYLVPAIAHPWTRVLLKYAAPQPGERVLDVACGTGSVARHVAPVVGTPGKVVALDVSPDMLTVARSLPAPAGATIEWRQGDAVSLDLLDDAFDLVVCQQGLQFFPDRAASVREMGRVLTAGKGRVAISVWQALDRHPVYEALLTATARHLGVTLAAVDVSFSLWDADELRALLSDAGFQRVEIVPRSLDVHLPEPERFAQLTVLGAATSISAFARLDAAERSTLVDAITAETQAVADRYRVDDTLRFTMSTHIGVAYTS
ncbi:MAG: class I SAM-dependent methyltransferase [Candidatus Acidiferrales bacterium]